MPGPAPKEERRRRNVPARGEWVDIPAKNPDPAAPEMPRPPKEGWSDLTKQAWASWWADGAATMWTPADLEALSQLVDLHNDYSTFEGTRGKSQIAGELRQRMDGLGLTQKGKRDMRWRPVTDEATEERPGSKKSRYQHLRSVPDAVAGA